MYLIDSCSTAFSIGMDHVSPNAHLVLAAHTEVHPDLQRRQLRRTLLIFTSPKLIMCKRMARYRYKTPNLEAFWKYTVSYVSDVCQAFPINNTFLSMKWLVSVCFAMAMIADILLTTALIYVLRKSRTGFKQCVQHACSTVAHSFTSLLDGPELTP